MINCIVLTPEEIDNLLDCIDILPGDRPIAIIEYENGKKCVHRADIEEGDYLEL